MIGKILGVFFGMLFGGPLGALFGLFLGHQFDKARRLNQSGFARGGFNRGGFGGADQAQRQEEFLNAAYAVMGHVAKAKGQVTPEEIQLATIMMDRMNLNNEQKRAAQEAFRDGKSAEFPLERVLDKVRISSGGRHDLLQFFLELQISAAFADGSVHPTEREVLHRIAQGLGFSAQQLEQRLRMQEAAFRFQQGGGNFGGGHYQGGHQGNWQQASSASQLSDAYDVLGISEDADSKAVKRA
jgi:DnaJ like chaperone protein